ncbi:hypothetical protein [Agromyces soli]|uniref:DUF4386 family protein n=1 Tax=Agromyces soli TaxID=659012 RepID=A0ABY4AUE9_9MICO|nr:hypothetical protein [Agromyces soli]UOE26802.1 hypothetical protein MTP13_03195 [Agromyces soli]
MSRLVLLWVQAFIGITAAAGGFALVVGALSDELTTALSPPEEYLAGSPFGSYLVPGLILALGLGGVHLVAFVALLRRAGTALIVAAVAGYMTLIWIFVQMMVIPFSPLQLVYFGLGAVELGLVLLLLGLFDVRDGRVSSSSSSPGRRSSTRFLG